MSTSTLTGTVLAQVADPARPLLTYYNERTGERTELSAATLGNWAAKIGNYLRDETMAAPGDPVRVDLPEHWQSAAVLLGAWWAGLQVETADGTAGTVFTSADRLDDPPDAETVVVLPLDPFAMGSPSLPIGIDDFGTVVRPHGDQFRPAGAGTLALDELSVDQVLTAAADAAAADGVVAGARVLSTRPWTTGDQVITGLLAPLLAGAALVWVDGADEDRLTAIAATEKTDLLLR